MKLSKAVLQALKEAIAECDSADALDALVGSFAEDIKTELADAIDARRGELTKSDLLLKDAGLVEIIETRPEIVDHILAAYKDEAPKEEKEEPKAEKEKEEEAPKPDDETLDALKAERDGLQQKISALEAQIAEASDSEVDLDAITATLREGATRLGIEDNEDTNIEQLVAAMTDALERLPSKTSSRGRGNRAQKAARSFELGLLG